MRWDFVHSFFIVSDNAEHTDAFVGNFFKNFSIRKILSRTLFFSQSFQIIVYVLKTDRHVRSA